MTSKDIAALVRQHLDACEKRAAALEEENAELRARLAAEQGKFSALLTVSEESLDAESADLLRLRIAELEEELARQAPIIDAVETACSGAGNRKYSQWHFFPVKDVWREYLKRYFPDTWKTWKRKP